MNNYAFIDGQNLHLWVKADNRQIDLNKFMIYLRNKYKVSQAFYYIWFYDPQNAQLYHNIQLAWFNLVFKKQTVQSLSNKKWNIDSDMIFEIMRLLLKEPGKFDKIVLVTWDWDFKILVDFLLQEWRFEKILLPNRQWSSLLLRRLPGKYRDTLNNVKQKIQR